MAELFIIVGLVLFALAVLPFLPEPVVAIDRAILEALISAAALYLLAAPRVYVEPDVTVRRSDRQTPTAEQCEHLESQVGKFDRPRAYPSFRYGLGIHAYGFVRPYRAHITAYIFYPFGPNLHPNLTTSVPVPLSRADIPAAPLGRWRARQTPGLCLEDIPWASHVSADRWPTQALDLRERLHELNGALRVQVESTSAIFQIVRVKDRVFESRHVKPQRDTEG